MPSDELIWFSALELAQLVRSKQISPVELTEAVLARIEALDPRINAFCLLARDHARRAAKEAEIAVVKNEPLGLLQGVPVSIKDVIFTRGLRTTGGSRLFAEAVPEEDAVAVGRLRAAGATVATCVLHYKPGHNRFPGDEPDYYAEKTDGWIVYPWDPDRLEGPERCADAPDMAPEPPGARRAPAGWWGRRGQGRSRTHPRRPRRLAPPRPSSGPCRASPRQMPHR